MHDSGTAVMSAWYEVAIRRLLPGEGQFAKALQRGWKTKGEDARTSEEVTEQESALKNNARYFRKGKAHQAKLRFAAHKQKLLTS